MRAIDREEEATTVPVRMTVEISDEDWNDPAFQVVWKEMIEEEVLKVVEIEEEMPKRLLHGEKAQSAMEYLILTGAAIVGAAVIYAFKGLQWH